MNAFRLIPLFCVFIAATCVLRADEPAPAKEDLGCDIYNGKTNKIDRVMLVDPRFVWVLYANDTGSRRIPRDELPPILAAKYPYDSTKAAAYIQTKAGENQAQINGQRLLLQESEQDLNKQITALKKQQADNQAEINTVSSEIKTLPRKSKGAANDRGQKINLLKAQDDLRVRLEALNAKLKDVHAKMDALP